MRQLLALSLLFSLVLTASAASPARLYQNLKAGKKQTVVTYGTSLTAGGAWVSQVEKSLNSQFSGLLTVINSGKSAMWSEWGVTNIDEKVIDHKPDTVFIEFAINDAFEEYKCSVDDSRKNLNTMIDRILEKLPQCEIILLTMNPPVNNTAGPEPRGMHLDKRPNYLAYYNVYRGVAGARGLRLIDNLAEWEKVLARGRLYFDKWVPDGIHPNEAGSEYVTTSNILHSLQGIK